MNTKMTMNFELITPIIANRFLATNTNNRNISRKTVEAYAQDLLAGNWDESVGSAISIDENGILRDGQHRLTAIVETGVSVWMWVCRGVSSNGIYDNNRKRSSEDQVNILKPELEKVYKQQKYITVAKLIINGFSRRPVTPKEIVDFTEKHKDELDGFFTRFPQHGTPKISITAVRLALYMAYANGVSMNKILDFYKVLCSGMSTKQEEFPIIAYRNYLKDSQGIYPIIPEVARCQYALKKYLTGSCIKRTVAPDKLLWPLPYQNTKEEKTA